MVLKITILTLIRMESIAMRERAMRAAPRIAHPYPLDGSGGQAHRSVVIAVVPMGMVEVTAHQEIDVVAVRYRLVAAASTVNVPLFVPLFVPLRDGRAVVRVCPADRKNVFINVIPVRMVQMSVVQIVNVVIMDQCRVATGRAVLVVVTFVCLV